MDTLTPTLSKILDAEKQADKILKDAESKKKNTLEKIAYDIEVLEKDYKDKLMGKKAEMEKLFLKELNSRRKKIIKDAEKKSDEIMKTKIDKRLIKDMFISCENG